MADLKSLGDEIRALLRQLNGRQKATLLAFGAVILVPLLWLSVRSGEESWLPVYGGVQFETGTQSQVEKTLRENGLTDLRIDGQRVFVPSEKLALADAALTAAEIANPQERPDTGSTSPLFSIFDPPEAVERESQERLHRNIERALATVSGIENATVISSRSKPTRWGQKPQVAAAVYVLPSAGGRLSAGLRSSICTSVAKGIPDLVPERIVVIDRRTGRSWTPNADGSTGIDLQDLAEHYETRIESALTWIPNAEVTVRLLPDFLLAVPEAATSVDPGESRSAPNQPGSVIADGAGASRKHSVQVEVLVPGTHLARTASGSDSSSAVAAASQTKRIVSAVEEVLPIGIAADVNVSQKATIVAASAAESAEDTTAFSPIVVGLVALVLVATVLLFRRLRPESAAGLPANPDAATEDHSVTAQDPAAVPPSRFLNVSIGEEAEALLPEQNSTIDEETSPQTESTQPRFKYLRETGPRDLYRLLAGEHPQTMALVLRHLPTKQATDVVGLLPSGIQSEVIRRIAEADLTGEDVVGELEQTLRARAASKPVVAGTREERTTASPAASRPAPSYVSPLERFEEIVQFSPPNLKRVVDQVEESLWAEALHGASQTLRFRVIASLPPQQARSVRARLNGSAPNPTTVATNRSRILETVNSLQLQEDSQPLRHEFVA